MTSEEHRHKARAIGTLLLTGWALIVVGIGIMAGFAGGLVALGAVVLLWGVLVAFSWRHDLEKQKAALEAAEKENRTPHGRRSW